MRIETLSESQNHRCCYCTHVMILRERGAPITPDIATRDHVEPRAYGGSNGDNLVAACQQCNNLRDDMDAHAFYHLLQKWFKRIEGLWEHWHVLDRDTLEALRQMRLMSQNRQLISLGRTDKEFAFRHFRLIYKYGYQLPYDY